LDIDIDPNVLEELEFLVSLHRKYGAENQQDTVEGLINSVLRSIADGSRRPGSWERELLIPMGLVPNCVAAEVYRSQYGRPKDAPQPNE
jgi:hypothetical protein